MILVFLVRRAYEYRLPCEHVAVAYACTYHTLPVLEGYAFTRVLFPVVYSVLVLVRIIPGTGCTY